MSSCALTQLRDALVKSLNGTERALRDAINERAAKQRNSKAIAERILKGMTCATPVPIDGDSSDEESSEEMFKSLLRHAKKNNLPIEVGSIKVYKTSTGEEIENLHDVKHFTMKEIEEAVDTTLETTPQKELEESQTVNPVDVNEEVPNATNETTRCMGRAFDGPFEMLSPSATTTYDRVQETLTQVMAYGSINAFDVTSLLVNLHSPLIKGECVQCDIAFESLEQAIPMPHARCSDCHKRICLTCALKRSETQVQAFSCKRCMKVEQ